MTIDLQATGVAAMHSGDGASVVVHSLPCLELQLPPRGHVATWRWRGEAVLTCSGHPFAARIAFNSQQGVVTGRVVDADSLCTMATVHGSLAGGVWLAPAAEGADTVLLGPAPHPVPTIDLDDLGARRMALLWSVLHDTLMFALPLSLRPLHLHGAGGERGEGGRGVAALPPCIVVRACRHYQSLIVTTIMSCCPSTYSCAHSHHAQAARARGEVPRYAFYLRLHSTSSPAQ